MPETKATAWVSPQMGAFTAYSAYSGLDGPQENILMVPHDGHIDCPHGHDCGWWADDITDSVLDEIDAHFQEKH